MLREGVLAEGEDTDNGIVLVACKDERSCLQLEECITNSPKKVIHEEWKKYLLNKVQLRDIVHKKKKPKDPKPKGFGILDGVTPIIPAQNAETTSISKQEHDALLAAASKLRNVVENDHVVEDSPQPDLGRRGCAKRKRKVGNRNGPVFLDGSGVQNNDKEESTIHKIGMSDSKNKVDEEETNHVSAGRFCETMQGGASVENIVLRRHTNPDAAARNGKPLPPVHFYALESDQPILDILKPSIVIVYHPDMAFVREIEVYKAENPSKRLKVYFLFYEDSTEVQKFEASIRRENGAFESLIRQKSMMMIPVDQSGHGLGLNSTLESDLNTTQNSVTRKAGGRKEPDKEMQVIVDMREFMSSLPSVLHQKGMRIIPVTLEVGDYILSPLICVERKSIQDLFMSFTSGRLYHQVETMVRYYRIPVLLIEFSQDKSFSFQSASDIGDDVTPNSIISKLSLLSLHFPRLRIIWSRSLHATAEIFASLKANQDEPDETKAIRVGVPSEEGIVENDVRAENYNTSAVEFLRRLPGVTDSNYRAIMDGCKSLAELALLPVEKLAELMGGHKAARTLRDFLDAKYPTLL
ncbi:DNA repair endonuclease UVH1 [Spatholobus suberectus]|nr:DNA repair endonuclease UVH1 [Spatholobus suberectus]